MASKPRSAAAIRLAVLTLMTTAACLGAAEAGAAQLTASWIDNAQDTAMTRLERRLQTATTFTAIADVSPGVTAYVDATVAAGTTYCYRVLAYDADGVSPYSDEVCALPAALRLAFTNPASGATVSGTTTVTMAATGGSEYTFAAKLDGTSIYAGTNPSFSWNTTAVANGSHTLTAAVTMNGQTATATLAVAVTNGNASTAFADVPLGDAFSTWIDALARTGITGGCATNPPQYCPDATVTRAQMAVFLLRSMAYPGTATPPSPTGTMFADVPASHPLAGWIEGLSAMGITGGCGTPPQYCPDAAVTRGEMAVFLLRAEHGAAYVPPPPTRQTFADVPPGHPFAGWITRLAAEDITGGCATNPTRYCPAETVTRAEMAVFLVRTFGLPL